MSGFQYQRGKKRESEEKIVNALGGEERRFTELLRLTGLSKPVLSDHLHRMRKERKIKNVSSKENRPRYKLTAGILRYGYIQRILFSYLSTKVFNDLHEALEKGSLPNKEFIEGFGRKIGIVAMYTLLMGLEKVKEDPDESGMWFEEAFGNLIQKYSWRKCFYRQIVGGSYDLKRPVDLREPIRPEVKDELVVLPKAFEPGLTGRIHRELPPIPEDKIQQFKAALREAYPEEAKTLDDALKIITKEG